MQKYLSIYQIEEIVRRNCYDLDPSNLQQSRCICGIYENTPNLPGLTLPGGDLGEIVIALATAYSFGFEISYKGLKDSLKDTIGHKDILRSIIGDGHDPYLCPYLHALIKYPDQYGFDNEAKEQFNGLIDDSSISKERLINEPIRHKNEQALIILQSSKGIYPRYVFETDFGKWETSVLIYQKTLVNLRHKALCKKLIDNNAVKLFKGLDEEYLYEVVSEMTDIHLYETLQHIDNTLPIYSVKETGDGNFDIKKLQ